MQNGVYETATGDLLRYGFGVDFTTDGSFNPGTETFRTDVPVPAFRRGQNRSLQMHRWDGSAWILVDQPGRLRLTSDRPLDPDGVPVAAANGKMVHTITIQKVNANGNPINAGSEQIRVLAGFPVAISDTTPSLVNGQVQVTVGPIKQIADGFILAGDPARVIKPGRLEIRFRSRKATADPVRPPGYVSGVRLEVISNTQVRLGTIGEPSEARDSTNTYDMQGSGAVTLDINVSGVNGLQPGLTPQPNTWYAVLVIADTTEVNPIRAMFTDEANYLAPTLPAGYNVFRRVGWVRRNGSGNFLRAIQTGANNIRKYSYDAVVSQLVVLNNGNAATPADVDLSSLVPPTSRFVRLGMDFVNTLATDRARLRVKGSAIPNPPFIFRPGIILSTGMSTFVDMVLDSNQMLQYVVDQVTNSLSLAVLGYDDEI